MAGSRPAIAAPHYNRGMPLAQNATIKGQSLTPMTEGCISSSCSGHGKTPRSQKQRSVPIALTDDRGLDLVELLSGPLLQELEHGAGGRADRDVGHQRQVLNEAHSLRVLRMPA